MSPRVDRSSVEQDRGRRRHRLGSMLRPRRRRLLLEALEDRRLLAGAEHPNVVLVERADANPTNAASVAFTVTFDEPVTGVDAADFRLAGTSQTASVSEVSPVTESGVAVYRVDVLTGSGDGTIRLDVIDNNSIRDLTNKMLGGPGPNNGGYTSGELYTIDKTAPTAMEPTLIGTPSANASTVEYNVSFSEPVTGVDVSDFQLIASGISGAVISSVTGSGTSYVVALATGSGEGTLQLSLLDDDTIVDAASNPLGGLGAGTPLMAPALAIDLVAPETISISTAQASPTNAELVDFTVTFSEAVVNVGLNDFVLTTGGALTGAMLSNVVGTGASYTISVNTGSGDGTIQLGIAGTPTIDDVVGNALPASSVTSPAITVDKTSPATMSMSLLDPSPTNASSVRYRVTFAEPVVGVFASNLEAYTSIPPDDLSGLAITSVSGSGTTYDVTVTSTGGSGPIFLRLVNDGNFADLAGNQPSIVSGSGSVYVIDRVAPVIESITLEDPTPTNAQSLRFLVTFSEPVYNFGLSDVAVDQTGLPEAYVLSVAAVPGTYQKRVTVIPGVGEGSLSIDVLPRAAVTDYAGNSISASAIDNPAYTVDTRSPLVTSITRVGPSPTNASSIDFAVTFSESVVSVSESDFALITSGVTGATISQVTGSGANYTVSAATGSADGTIRLDAVTGGTLRDLHGNGLGTAATGPVAMIDKTPPSVLSFDRLSSSPTSALSVDFRIVFSEAVTGVDSGDFVVSAVGINGASIEPVTGSGTTYDLVVTYSGGDGTLGLNLVDNDSIVDAVPQPLGGIGSGNGDIASSVYEVATTGAISGRVVHDVDRDGYADLVEVGLAGATVYVDSNHNGRSDLDEPFVTSLADDPATLDIDESGSFSLHGLNPGEHRIRVAPPVGWLVTNPAIRLASTGELSLVEIQKDGVGGTDYLDEAAGVTESPDGNFVYVASYFDDSITVFSRNPEAGGLTQIQQVVNLVGGVQGLLGAQSIAITPDGASLYVASALDDALVMFSRDDSTGLLTYQDHLENGVGGVDGLGEPVSVRASDDGMNLYVAATSGGSLAVFHRDPETGLVTFAQKLTGSTAGAFSVDLSPDQRQVYLASTNSHAVTVYERDLSTGLLALSQTIHDSDDGIVGLFGPAGISVSPDGANVYVASHFSQGTVVFNRHPITGHLTFNQFVTHSFSIGNPDPVAVLVSPDGHHVVVTFETRDAIAVYSRNLSTGQLTLVETHQDGVNGLDGLNGAWDVEFSGDNRTLYVVGAYDDAVVVFNREVGPLSASFSTAVVTAGQTTELSTFAAVNAEPMVESITHSGAAPVTGATAEFDVVFSEPVFGVDPGDFVFVGTFGSATASAIVGSGAAYTLTVDLADGFQGTLSVRARAEATITDTDGASFGENQAADYDVVEIDRKSPSLLSVEKLYTDPTNRLTLRYQVEFSESVTGFDAGDLMIAADGVTGAAITSVAGSGSSYVVTVTHPGGEEGMIGVTLSDDDSIVDAVGRTLNGVGTSLIAFPAYTVQYATIQGVVFGDVDEDRAFDTNESGVAGMTVFVDLDQDGVFDANEPTTTTREDDPATSAVNEAGRYSIEGLTDGTYTVAWQGQSQWRQSLPAGDAPHTVTVAVAEGVTVNANFGIHFIVPAEITGRLWRDLDQNGRQDIGEGGVAGITVYVDLNENGLFDAASEPSGLTAVDDPATEDIDETGQYRITPLAPGSYLVRVDSSDWLLVNGNGWDSVVTNTYVDASNLSADNKTLKKSPDGKHLYVFDQLADDIVVLAMPQSPSETLTQVQVLNNQFSDTTNKGGDIAFSPSGSHMYMIEDETREVAVYQRNLSDGALVRIQTLFASDIGPYALEVAPDGNHLYVAGGYIARFTIDPLDGTLSSPSYIGTAARVADLAFSSDGTRLYATDSGNVVIRVFSRDIVTGAISQIQATGSQVATSFSHTGIGSIEISADDRDVYVAAPYGDIVWHFQTLPEGTLIYAGHYPLDTDSVRDIPLDLQLSSDGEILFVALGLDSAVQVMYRDPGHGGLTLGMAFGSEDPNLLGVNESSTSLLDNSDDGRTVVRVNSRAQQIHAYTAPLLVTGAQLSVFEGRVTEANRGIYNPPPTWVSTTTSAPNLTNASSIVFEVTFSESVTGVDASDFQLQMAGLSGAVISSVVGGPAVYAVTVDTSAADGHGELVLRLADDDSIVDATGGPLAGIGAGAYDSAAIEVDLVPPTVVAVTALDPVFSSSQSVRYLVEFNEGFCLVDTGDFVLIQNGVTGASVSSVSLGATGNQYVVVVDTGTGDGTIQLTLVDDDTIVDRAGNPLAGAGLGNGDFLTAPTYTIERNPRRNISGFLFTDANGNGIQDGGESPLGGVVVYVDLNRDGVMDAGDPRATSGTGGSYTLVDIPTGDVVVRISDMTRWVVTTPHVPIGRLFTADNANLYELNPQSGAVMQTHSSVVPPTRGLSARGIAFDGHSVFIWEDVENHILVVNPDTGSVTREITSLGTSDYHGLAIIGTTLYALEPNSDSIVALDSVTGAIINTFDIPQLNSSTPHHDGPIDLVLGLGESADGSSLIAATQSRRRLVIDPSSGLIVGSFVDETNHHDAGLAGGYGRMFVGVPWVPKIEVHASGQRLRSLPVAGVEDDRTYNLAYGAKSEPAVAVALDFGPDVTGVDFGLRSIVNSVSGTQFEDLNVNGIWDSGEPPLAGATVFADLNDNGFLEFGEPSTLSAADGTYTLDAVPHGAQTIRTLSPVNYEPTGVNASSNRLFGVGRISTASSSTGYSLQIRELDPITGQSITTLNTSLPVMNLHSVVFDGSRLILIDNGLDKIIQVALDGTLLAEAPLPGVNGATVYAYGAAIIGGTVYIATVGGNLPLQLIRYDSESNQFFGAMPISRNVNQGSGLDAMPSLSSTATESIDGKSIWLFSGASGDTRVFEIDPLTARVTSAFNLPGTDGNDYGAATVGGELLLRGLETSGRLNVYDGQLNLVRNLPSPDTGGLAGGVYRDTGKVVEVGESPISGVNAGHRSTHTRVSGVVSNDLNGNGIAEPEEAAAGMTVYLDANRNGLFDSGESATTTLADGSYAFERLVPGDYTVRVHESGGMGVSTAQTETSLYALEVVNVSTIRKHDSITGQVLREFPAPSPVTKLAGLAVNEFGVYYSSREGIWRLDPDTGTVLDFFATSPNALDALASVGGYLFGQNPYTDTITKFHPLTGAVVATFNINAINGTSYDLLDNLGESTSGTHLITRLPSGGGLLINPDTGVIDQWYAHNYGAYAMAGAGGEQYRSLGAGSIVVEIEPEKLIRVTPVNYEPIALGAAVVTSEEYSLRATDDAQFEAIDFMLFTGSSLSGKVWHDVNGNGVEEPDEPGIANWTVYLDSNNNGLMDEGEPSTVTASDDPQTTAVDEAGTYRFSSLPPGGYQVRQLGPQGWTQSSPTQAAYPMFSGLSTGFVYDGFVSHPEEDLRLSQDGRFLVYASNVPQVPHVTGSFLHIYLLDRSTDQVELISMSSAEVIGNGHHFEPDVSADGRYVIFRSGSTNLVPEDTSSTHDIFVRDRLLGTTSLVSKSTTGGSANGHTADGRISPDGNRVIFMSLASNLIMGDSNGQYDTYMRHLNSGTTERLSLTQGDGEVYGNPSWGGDMSTDGRYVAFQSASDSLVPGDNNQRSDTFWRDRVTGDLRLVSVSASGEIGNGATGQRSISDDGRWVAFDSNSTNLTDDTYPLTHAQFNVFLKDMQTGAVIRISHSQSFNSRRPEISADGRWITFESDAGLDSSDTNQRMDIYLYDRLNDSVRWISRASDGSPGSGHSINAVLSGDGSTIAFTTTSTNLPSNVGSGGIITVQVSSPGLPAAHYAELSHNLSFEDQDFGVLEATGSISGYQYSDINANGLFDIGDTPLSGATVYADLNGNGSLDSGEPATVSDSNGFYSLTGFAQGDYEVRAISPQGYRPASVSDRLFAVSVENSVYRLWELSPISGAVISSVLVNVPANNDSQLAFDGQRLILINNSTDMLYELAASGTVLYQRPLGELIVGGPTSNQYSPVTDYGAAVIGGTIFSIRASWGHGVLTVYDPVAKQFIYSKEITYDWGLTSLPGSGEPTVPKPTHSVGESADGQSILMDTSDGRTITIDPVTGVATFALTGMTGQLTALSRTGFAGKTFIFSTSTNRLEIYDAQGELIRAAWGLPPLIGLGGGQYFESRAVVSLPLQGSATDINLSHVGTLASLSGSVRDDHNGNGLLDAGENGLANVAVYLDINRNGQRDAGEPLELTNSSGRYEFTNVTPGEYVVRQESLDGKHARAWTDDYTRLFTHVRDSTTGSMTIYELDPFTGSALRSIPVPGTSTEAIGLAAEGSAVYLSRGNALLKFDADSGSLVDTWVLPSASGADGLAIIDHVAYVQNYLTDKIVAIDLLTRQTLRELDLGLINYGESGSINLVGSLGESADGQSLAVRANSSLFIVDPLTGLITQTLVSGPISQLPSNPLGFTGDGGEMFSSGLFSASNQMSTTILDPLGLLRRRIAFPIVGQASGYAAEQVTATEHRVRMFEGQHSANLDFGNVPSTSTISGIQYIDLDQDGVLDSGESPLANVMVFVDLNANDWPDQGEPSAVSGIDGRYVITNVPLGENLVRTLAPDGYLPAQNRTPVGRLFGTTTINDSQSPTGMYLRLIDANPKIGNDIRAINTTISVSAPYSAAFDGKRLIVADNTLDRLLLVALDGTLLDSVPLPGTTTAPGATTSVFTEGPVVIDGTIYLLTSGGGMPRQLIRFDPENRLFYGAQPLSVLVDQDPAGSSMPFLSLSLSESPDGRSILAFSSMDARVFVIDPLTARVTSAIDLPRTGGNVYGATAIGSEWFVRSDSTASQTDVYDDQFNLLRTIGFTSVSGLAGGMYRETGMVLTVTATGIDAVNQGHRSTATTIEGMVTADADGDGIADPGETPDGGVTVYLDANRDGILNSGEATTTTLADGSYSFTGLLPGDYVVRVADAIGVWTQTPASDAVLYASDGQMIRKHDPITGQVLRAFPVPAPGSNSSGMATDANGLYYSTTEGLWILQHDTGQVRGFVQLPAGSNSGVAAIGGKVFVVNAGSEVIYRINPLSAKVEATIDINVVNALHPSAPFDLTGNLGESADAAMLLTVDASLRRLRIHPDTGVVEDVQVSSWGAPGQSSTGGEVYRSISSQSIRVESEAGDFIRNVTTGYTALAIAASTFTSSEYAVRAAQDRNFSALSFLRAVDLEFGDAPESYRSALASDGARHRVVSGVYLGSIVDTESDAMHPGTSLDDDGVTISGNLITSSTHSFEVTTSTAGTLAVWIDFDGDGSFGASERSEHAMLTGGVTMIQVSIPANAVAGQTYARFRFSTDAASLALPTGLAPDGEVEDYAVTIYTPAAPTDVELSSTSINENRDTSAADLFFAELSAVDVDAGDTHTYSLVSGTGDSDNARFVVADDRLFIKQGETIDYETQPSYTIRLRVTDATGLVYEKPMQLQVNNLVELSKENIIIGDGTAQRSRVETFSIEFDSEVVIQDGAFIVTKRGSGGGQVGVSYQFRAGSGNRIVDLSFSGVFVEYGSLVDGNYELTVVGSKITSIGGQPLDANGDGIAGDDFDFGASSSDQFFRLFGDSDGDRDVDSLDLLRFRRSLNKPTDDSNYRWYFDERQDGDVDSLDYLAFRRRLNQLFQFE